MGVHLKKIKLITFPYAGGSSFGYGSWRKYLPSNFVLVTPDYGGHGLRYNKPLASHFDDIVQDIYGQIVKECILPFVFYGHSLGAIIAVYTAQLLYERNGIMPQAFILGACRSPKTFPQGLNISFSDTQLLAYLKDVRELSKEFLESNEFKSYIFPGVKNDFRIAGLFNYSPLKLLPCPILCVNGEQDFSVKDDDVKDWENCIAGTFNRIRVPGAHFFHEEFPELVCQILSDYIVSLFI